MGDKLERVLLCDYCIQGIQSHGENVWVGREAYDYGEAGEENVCCEWCKEIDTLYDCRW